MRTLFTGILISCFLTLQLCLPGCTSQNKQLTVASHVWPGYEMMYLARREGQLSEKVVRLRDTGSATESLQLLESGQIDAAALTLDEALRAVDRGTPLTIVLVFDVSMGADVVMAADSVSSLAGLRAKRIGVEASALGALMLAKALEKAGLSNDAVQIIPLTPDEHVAAWRTRKYDAVITYEPVATKLQQAGMHRIFDSRQLPGTILDVLAVRTAVVHAKQDAIRQLVCAHFEGLKHFRTNPQDAAYRMSARFRLPASEVLAAFHGLDLPGVVLNKAYLEGSPSGIMTAVRTLAPIMSRTGLLSHLKEDPQLSHARFLPDGEM